MSKKIEVGMMVRIVGPNVGYANAVDKVEKYRGHIGRVVGIADFGPNQIGYDIEGAEPERFCFPACDLEPIDPPQESDDIKSTREQGAPSFSKMMEGMKQPRKIGAPSGLSEHWNCRCSSFDGGKFNRGGIVK